MPGCGALNPFPIRFGGGRRRIKYILDSLNAQMGTGFDTSEMSTNYLENLATARLLSAMWSTNQRLANQFDSRRMTTCLPRHEKILAIRPKRTDSNTVRRARIAELEAREGKACLFSVMVDTLTTKLGAYFVSLDTIGISIAVITVPDGTYPWGSVLAGAPWSSTIDHLLVRMQKPAGATEADFYGQAARVVAILGPILPAWVTVDWYRAPSGATNGAIVAAPILVTDGPTGAGFYLDDEHNLDNNIFDV